MEDYQQLAIELVAEEQRFREEEQAKSVELLTRSFERGIHYREVPLVAYYGTKWDCEGKFVSGRFRFDMDFRCDGLLQRILGDEQVVAVPLFVNVDKQNGGYQVALNRVHEALWKHGFAVIADSWIVEMGGEAWKRLVTTFPNAIDLRAYASGVLGPLQPGGFKRDVEIRLGIMTTTGGREAGTDGSGSISPGHPVFQSLGIKPCPLQLRINNAEGWFGKGIVTPDPRLKGDEIFMDLNQVKGTKKPEAEKARAEGIELNIRADLGILQYWNTRGKISCCFEVLENLKRNETTEGLVTGLLVEAFDKKVKAGGSAAILGELGNGPHGITRLGWVTAFCQKLGVNPLAIHHVKMAVQDRLSRWMYLLAQGAGFRGSRKVMKIDNGVPDGCCVVGGIRPGKWVAVWRLPLVATQGILKMKVVAPLPHHLIDGQVVVETIFINSKHAVLHMIGDDDGDTCVVTTNKKVLGLVDHKITDKVFALETKSAKITTESDTEEGLRFLVEPRGEQTGLYTILRSKSLPSGDLLTATLMSFVLQAEIDSMKKSPAPVNYEDPGWKLVDGVYTVTNFLPTLDMESVLKWHSSKFSKGNRTGWRAHIKNSGKKAIVLNDEPWPTCEELAKGWPGGNLVHYCHDTAAELWNEQYQKEFGLEVEPVDVTGLLDELLEEDVTVVDWKTYQIGLRSRSGLSDFLRKMKVAMKFPPETKSTAIDRLYESLELKLQKLSSDDLISVWKHETCHTEGSLDNAIRAVAWEGSPILAKLGLASEATCRYPTEERVLAAMDYLEHQDNPSHALAYAMVMSPKHEEATGHLMTECLVCKDVFKRGLMGVLRTQVHSTRSEFGKALISKLNH